MARLRPSALGALACLEVGLGVAQAATEVIPLTMPEFASDGCQAPGPLLPVRGSVVELPLEEDSEALAWAGSSTGATGWDMMMEAVSPSQQETGCRHKLWARSSTMECLEGSWLAVVGASSANIWMVQLVNMLVPGALDVIRDKFNIDGVWTQMIDIVLVSGKVVYYNVVVDTERKKTDDREGVHTVERDRDVLTKIYKQLKDAPAFSADAVRITHFSAPFWDSAHWALLALEEDAKWRKAEVSVIFSIGLWYINSLNCQPWDNWCKTRPEYVELSLEEIVEKFTDGMHETLDELDTFCAKGGRAGARGCAVTSIDHCPWMQGEIWDRMYAAVNSTMMERGSSQLRYLDVWTLTTSLGIDCIGEHQSPMSTLWTWQIFLNSICDPSLAAEGSVAVFKGERCRAAQVNSLCEDYEDQGYQFDWECALSAPCELQAFTTRELVRQDYDECSDYMTFTGCGWTQSWNCKGQAAGSQGTTKDDGSLGYRCCCSYGFWSKSRYLEAQTRPALPPEESTENMRFLVGLAERADDSVHLGSQPQSAALAAPLARIRGEPSQLVLFAGAAAVAAAALWLRRPMRPPAQAARSLWGLVAADCSAPPVE